MQSRSKYESGKYQDAVRELVGRGVIHRATNLMSEIAPVLDQIDSDYDSLLYPEPQREVDTDQYFWRVDHDERGEFHASIYLLTAGQTTDGETDAEDLEHTDAYYLSTEPKPANWNEKENGVYVHMTDEFIQDTVSAGNLDYYSNDFYDDILESQVGMTTYTAMDATERPAYDEYDSEIYEWWIVDDFFADKLRDKGEHVVDVFDFTIWGRCTTGQAIALDRVVCDIYDDMHGDEWKTK